MSRERVQGVVLGNELSRNRCRGDRPSHWTRCVVPTRSLLWTRSATPSYGPAGAGRREDDSDHQEPDADRRDEKGEVRHHGGHREGRRTQENVRDEHQGQRGRAASDEILSHPPPFRRIRGSGLNGLPQTWPRLANRGLCGQSYVLTKPERIIQSSRIRQRGERDRDDAVSGVRWTAGLECAE